MALNKIVALTDFTEASSITLENAYLFATEKNTNLEIAHMITEISDKAGAINQIENQCKKLQLNNPNTTIHPVAFLGNKYTDIAGYLEEAKPDIVFMPTHGKKDIQLILGSFAMKIISNTSMPFLVFQLGSPIRPLKKILVPLFANGEIDQKSIQPILSLAKNTLSSLFFVSPTYSTENEVKSLDLAKHSITKLLEKESVIFKFNQRDEKVGKFKDEILIEAQEQEVDLIALISGRNSKDSNVIQPKGLHQSMITNAMRLPVLCI